MSKLFGKTKSDDEEKMFKMEKERRGDYVYRVASDFCPKLEPPHFLELYRLSMQEDVGSKISYRVEIIMKNIKLISKILITLDDIEKFYILILSKTAS